MATPVPEEWKVPNVLAIFKKDSRGDPGNCSAVNFTAVPGKLVVLIIMNKITAHLEDHDLIGANQQRFCKGKSCFTNLQNSLKISIK